MQNDDKINYGQAIFSVAMIDLKTHTETIQAIDKKLEEANFVLNYVLKKDERSEELTDMLKGLALPEFAKVQKYLKDLKKLINKHIKRLERYFQDNPNKKEEFDVQLDILIPLFEEKEKFVNKQIAKCFDYIKANCEDIALLEV